MVNSVESMEVDEDTVDNGDINNFLEALENNLMKKIEPTGDCFYDCIVTAFDMEEKDVREFSDVIKDEKDDKVKALRRTAAMSLTPEMFESFKMSHQAGLKDYSFMSEMNSLKMLQEKMMESGREVGAGNSLWANEFEINAVCRVLHICCLVWDSSARKETDKLLRVGEEAKEFIIVKKVGEHYNLLYREDENGIERGVFTRNDLSEEALGYWGVDI